MYSEYVSNFLCTYQHIEETNDSDLCYKMQFLQSFGLDGEYDSEKIEKITNSLYEELKEEETFKILIDKIKKRMNNRMNVVGFLNGSEESNLTDGDIFCFVFSYEYFYKFHREYSLYKNKKNYNFDFIV